MPRKIPQKNTPLSRARATTALNRIGQYLSPTMASLVDQIIATLADDGSASVKTLHAALFPVADTASASAQLSKLITVIETTARGQSLQFGAAYKGAKGADIADRRLYFVGPPLELKADAEGLQALASEGLIAGQIGQVVVGERNVVLMTFNDHEYAAVRNSFWQTEEDPHVRRDDGVAVDSLGMHGGLSVLHYHCHHQGNHASQRAAADVWRAYRPLAIIAVGIAFGVDEARQTLGRVLVSSFICNYELGKIHKDGTITLRGPRPPASRTLVKAIQHLHLRKRNGPQRASWPDVEIGGMLSGQKLIDNVDYREGIKREAGQDDIVGGEMEAIGVQTALDGCAIDWVIVKGICDWADGKKNINKERQQRDAADNAAHVVKALLDEGGLYSDGRFETAHSVSIGPQSTAKAKAPRSLSARQLLLDAKNIQHLVARQTALPLNLDTIVESSNALISSDEDNGPTVVAFDDILGWVGDPQARPLYALLGEYGMGKTITCQRIADALYERRERGELVPIPLYFDLRKVERLVAANSENPGHVPTLRESVEDCLRHGYLHEGGEPPRYEEVLATIDQGALIIFDGLDEVLSRIGEKQGLTFTSNLLKIIPEAKARRPDVGTPVRVLLSCRTQFFRSFAEQNNHLTGEHRGANPAQQYRALLLQPFREEDIRAYLCAVMPGSDPDHIMHQIETVHNLRELATRPFTLKLVAKFIPRIEQWRAEGRPITGATLYREVAREWLIRDKEKQSFRPEDKERLAGELAAYLWRQSRRGLSARELESWLDTWLAKEDPHADFQSIAGDLRQEDLRNATFLKRHDENQGRDSRFEFAHSSLQEFFLADYLFRALKMELTANNESRKRWAGPPVSNETLDFLGQMLMEDIKLVKSTSPTHDLLTTFVAWRTPYLEQASELQLAYVIRAYKKGWPLPSIAGMDLTNANLSDWHFGAQDETSFEIHARKPRLNMNRVILKGANLRRAKFWHVSLDGADLAGAVATQAEFLECRAEDTLWTDADLRGAVFRRSSLFSPPVGYDGPLPTRWTGAHLDNTHFIECEGTPEQPIGADIRYFGERHDGQAKLAILQGHVNWTACCAMSPDGRIVLSGAGDSTLRVWNATSGGLSMVLHEHHAPVSCCAFAPDSRWILSGSRDASLRIWNIGTGQCLRTLLGHEENITSCDISRDGRLIVSASDDCTLRIWSAETGETERILRTEGGVPACCIFSPDSARIASVGHHQALLIWDAITGECLYSFKTSGRSYKVCTFSPDGRMLITGSSKGEIVFWDARSGEELYAIETEGNISALAVSADGKTLLSGDAEGYMEVWDIESYQCRLFIDAHEYGLDSCVISNDGETFLSVGDSNVKLWDSGSGECLLEMQSHNEWVSSTVISPDGKQLISTCDSFAYLWDLESGASPRVFSGHMSSIHACAISSSGRQFATASSDQTIRIWDIASGNCLKVLAGHGGAVHCCDFATGNLLLSSSWDQTVRLWNIDSGECLRIFPVSALPLFACAISPDGRLAVTGVDDPHEYNEENVAECQYENGDEHLREDDGEYGDDVDDQYDVSMSYSLRVWDVETGELRHTLVGHDETVATCTISPDSRLLVSGAHDNKLRIWDLHSGECIRVLSGHTSAIKGCAISGDGRRLVSASWDDSLRLWDMASGRCLRVFEGHEAGVIACDISSDGALICSGSWDSTIRLWNADTGECMRVMLGLAGGSAAWTDGESQVLHLSGNAWRYVGLQVRCV